MAGVQFCGRCGNRLAAAGAGAAAYAMPGYPGIAVPAGYAAMWAARRARVEQHGQALGIFWVLWGSFRLLALVFGALAFHSVVAAGLLANVPPVAAELMRHLLPVIAAVVVALSGLDLTAGIGLLTRKPWARVVAIVAGCLALLKLPFGTALGVYTLWVLAPRASGEEWQALTAGK